MKLKEELNWQRQEREDTERKLNEVKHNVKSISIDEEMVQLSQRLRQNEDIARLR